MGLNIKAKDVLIALSYIKKGNWDAIYSHIKEKLPLSEKDRIEAISMVKSNYITLLDDEYPDCLKNIYKPPFVLYYYGDISLLKSKYRLVAIGSRNPTLYQTDTCYRIIKELEESTNKEVVIISGMAKGMDSTMMRAAIDTNSKVISVIGSGIDNPYPKDNIAIYDYCVKNGLVLSEYPLNLEAKPKNFLFRNRILAALAPSIFVGSGKQRSGTNNSVYWATTYNKNVLALPCNQNLDDPELTNDLIKQGATPILSSLDLKDEILEASKIES